MTHPKAEPLTSQAVAEFRNLVYDDFRRSGRKMPWRKTSDPYRILVSEIMLQQTHVQRVEQKYGEFIAAFPDFPSLARAPLREVLRVWQGMGYNRRAVALQKTAQRVVSEFSGKLPDSVETLLNFPGIGAATAGAVVAFAFNKPTAFLETNVRRVFLHVFFPSQVYATVGGGYSNNASGYAATVGGGYDNGAADYATVGGGDSNDASARAATPAMSQF